MHALKSVQKVEEKRKLSVLVGNATSAVTFIVVVSYFHFISKNNIIVCYLSCSCISMLNTL